MTRENELGKAIENADMPPREYRIFAALLRQSARWKTAEILDRFQPSLADLTRMTKMSKPTLLAGLAHLEKHGWVIRARSAGGSGHKTAYQLSVGGSCNCTKPGRARPKTGAERAKRHREKRKWLAECEAYGLRIAEELSNDGVTELSSGSVTAEAATVKNPRDETVKNLDQNCQAVTFDSPAQERFCTKEGSDVGDGEKEAAEIERTSAGTAGEPASNLCTACGGPLDPVLTKLGLTDHGELADLENNRELETT